MPTKDGMRVISFATIDDHKKPDDVSFAGLIPCHPADAKSDTHTSTEKH
jgi:hypothetical protein